MTESASSEADTWAEEQSIGMLRDPAGRGALKHEGPVHLLVEIEAEGVEPLADAAEAGLLQAALEQGMGRGTLRSAT